MGLQPVFFISLDVHDYCIFTCIMCKTACKASNGIYEVQCYKCDKDVYPIHIKFYFLKTGIIITFHQVNKPMQ